MCKVVYVLANMSTLVLTIIALGMAKYIISTGKIEEIHLCLLNVNSKWLEREIQ